MAMSLPTYKLTGRFTIPTGSRLWVDWLDGGVPQGWEEIDLSTVLSTQAGWYILGDATSQDLLDKLSDEISNALDAAGAGPGLFAFTLDSTTGIVTGTFSGLAGDSAVLSFIDPTGGGSPDDSYWVRDWLRMDSTLALDEITIDQGSPLAGYRAHAFGLYPLKIQLKDNDRFIKRTNQATPDEGGQYTLSLAKRLEHRLGVWLYQSLPRASSYNEYHQFKDLLDFAANGWPVRYYPDKALTTAWAEVTNPYGYKVWTIDRSSLNWEPQPRVRSYLNQQEHELLLHATDAT